MTDISAKNAITAKPAGAFAPFEWMLAARYLRARRKEAFVSVIAGFSFLGILLGVATLIVVMAVMNGFRTELLSKILGVNGHIIVNPIERPLTDYDEVAKRLEALDQIKTAVPFVDGQALVSGPSGAFGALLRGARGDDLKKLKDVADNILVGSIDDFEEKEGVLIGASMARNLGVSLGDPVTIISPKGAITPLGVTPRIKSYPLAGVFKVGMHEFDANVAFMTLNQAQLYFNKEEEATSIELFVDNPEDLDDALKSVDENAGRPVWTTDWRRRHSTFFAALEVERNVMFIVLTMIVLVAALNIISGLTILVKDKSRDIAILRTIGASSGAVMRVFMITGASIGIVGTIAGSILGIIICYNVEAIRQFISSMTRNEVFPPELYYLSKLPADIQTGETTFIVAMAIGISFLATLYPAWRAARLDPVEALRYE